MSKFAKDNYSKTQRPVTRKNNFLQFSMGNLPIILYQLSKFEAPSCNSFWDTKFAMSKIAKSTSSKKKLF